MTKPELSAQLSQRYPAPWRSSSEGPDAQTLLLEHNREEELFQHIIGEAQHEKTPLEELLKPTLHLAFPHAKDSDLEHALSTIKTRSAEWQNNIDQDGNPCWISLSLPERNRGKNTTQSAAIRPGAKKNATPQKKNPLRSLMRLLLFVGIFALLYYTLIARGCAMP